MSAIQILALANIVLFFGGLAQAWFAKTKAAHGLTIILGWAFMGSSVILAFVVLV